MTDAVTTTTGEQVHIEVGSSLGAVKITVGNAEPFHLTSGEVIKLVEILNRHSLI